MRLWPKEKTTVYIYIMGCARTSHVHLVTSDGIRPFPSFSQSLITKFVSSTLPSPTTSTRHRIKAKFKSGTSVTHHIDMSSHQGHSEHSGPGRSGARDAYASRAIGIFFCFVLLSIFFY